MSIMTTPRTPKADSFDTARKIFHEPEALARVLARHREAGQIIVFGNGCFDLLHVGHVRYLEAARRLGDRLVIAVNTDASVRANRNGQAPMVPDHERMEVIAALAAVDYVVPLAERLPNKLLALFQPDYQAKGTDYSMDRMPEKEVVESYGGRIVFVGDPKDHSSSALRAKLDHTRSPLTPT